MTALAFGSVKGAPGVTTAVASLGHVWPSSRRVLIAECDPAGGDLLERLELDNAHGLVALAAAGPEGLSPSALWDQVQRAGGLDVLAATPTGPPMRQALTTAGDRLPELLAGLDADVLIDCGRLYAGSPALALFAAADLRVLVARPTNDELPRLRQAGEDFGAGRFVVLLVGKPEVGKPYHSAAKAEATAGIEIVAVLPDDRRGADFFGSPTGATRRPDRTLLIREARTAAARLLERAHEQGPSGTISHPEEVRR